MNFDIYVSSKIKKNFKDVVEFANRQNLNIEIKEFIKSRILDNHEGRLAEIKEDLRGFKGKLSMHAPYEDLNPVSGDEKIRELTAYRFNQAVDIAKELGITTIVFHTGYDAVLKKPYDFTKKFINREIKLFFIIPHSFIHKFHSFFSFLFPFD